MVLPYKYVIVAHHLNKTARKTKTLAYIRHTQLGFIHYHDPFALHDSRSKRRSPVGGQPVNTPGLSINGLSTHLPVNSGGDAPLSDGLLIGLALAGPETKGRVDGLSKELHSTGMSTASSNINTTSGLAGSSIGIEVGVSNGHIEAQEASIRMVGLDVDGISLGDTLRRAIFVEQRQSSIKSDHITQTHISHLALANESCSMGTQAVSNNGHILGTDAMHAVELLQDLEGHSSDGSNAVTSGNVVHRLRTSRPVHDNHVKVGKLQVGITNQNVHGGVGIALPSVDDDPGED